MEYLYQISVEFDESDKILLIPSFFGIKFIEINSGKLLRLIGKQESTERFLKLALYQGKAMKNSTNTASVSGTTANKKETDPTVYCTSFKKNKFYIFSRRQPEESEEKGHGINNRGKCFLLLLLLLKKVNVISKALKFVFKFIKKINQ